MFNFSTRKSDSQDVNLNTYTQTSIESRLQAAETLDTAFVN